VEVSEPVGYWKSPNGSWNVVVVCDISRQCEQAAPQSAAAAAAAVAAAVPVVCGGKLRRLHLQHRSNALYIPCFSHSRATVNFLNRRKF